MRIAFSGSGGTGKTTLVQELNKGLGFPVIGEGIREWLEDHNFTHFKELSKELTIKMQEDNLKRRIEIESSLQQFISDRSSVDNLVYALRWIGSVDTGEYDGWMAQYINAAMNHAETNYDIIFVLPWGEIEIEDDGLRSKKQWYQYMIQALIERHIYMLQRPYVYEVQKVGLQDRVDECMKLINNIDLSVLQ